MILKTVTLNDWLREFENNSLNSRHFSKLGLIGLYEYLDEFTNNNDDEPYIMDIIEIYSRYTEYNDVDDLNRDLKTSYKNIDNVSKDYPIVWTEGDRFIIEC